MTDKPFKEIMVGYSDKNMRGTYKLYNPETKRVIITRDVKWANWKMTNPVDTLNMFRGENKEDLVPCIEEDIIPTSEPEYKMPVHIIPDEGEIVRPNEIYENSSELMYHKKYADAYMSVYD